MSFDETDPEVLADLRLRDATVRDESRSRKAPEWVPPVIIERVPCRSRCGRVVEWTAEAEEAFAAFNRRLASAMDAPLDKTRIVFCDVCKATGRKIAADANRDHLNALSALIREFKASDGSDTTAERDLLDRIRKLRHPDVEGLIEAVNRQRSGRTRRPTRNVIS